MQIDPWLVSGVTVATSGSAAAAASRSSQPSVTAVSEFRITTSPAASRRPRFTVRTKPRFSGLCSTVTGNGAGRARELVDELAQRQLGRRVVDHEQLQRDAAAVGVPHDALEATRGVREPAVHRHDHGDGQGGHASRPLGSVARPSP